MTLCQKNKYRFPELTSTPEFTELKLWSVVPADSYTDLSESAQKVLKFLDRKADVTFSEIVTNVDLSKYFLRKAVNELIDKNLIARERKGKATRYNWLPSMIEAVVFANKFSESIRKISSVQN